MENILLNKLANNVLVVVKNIYKNFNDMIVSKLIHETYDKLILLKNQKIIDEEYSIVEILDDFENDFNKECEKYKKIGKYDCISSKDIANNIYRILCVDYYIKVVNDINKYSSTKYEEFEKSEIFDGDIFEKETQAYLKLNTILNGLNLPKNIFIAGSSILHSVYKKDIKFNDIDIYVNSNSIETVLEIIEAIKTKYNDSKIIYIRSKYILNVNIYNSDNVKVTKFQIIMTQVRNLEEIFASYHSDIVSIGYDNRDNRFYYSPYRLNTLISSQTNIFTNVLFENPNQTYKAYTKYKEKNLCYDLISCVVFDNMMHDKLNNYDMKKEQTYDNKYTNIELDSKNFLELYCKLLIKNDIGKITFSLDYKDCLYGDKLKKYYEVFKLRVSVICGYCSKLFITFDKEKICDSCKQYQIKLTEQLIDLTKNNSMYNKKILITGGRVGIGRFINEYLIDNDIIDKNNIYISSRNIEKKNYETLLSKGFIDENIIQCDLLNDIDVKKLEKMITENKFDIIILNAFETIIGIDKLKKFENNPDLEENKTDLKENKSDLEENKSDLKENKSVWFKTLDDYENNEIEIPSIITMNTSKLMRGFMKNTKNEKCIYITSSEAMFGDKSSLHPISNACKSYIEQLIVTNARICKIKNQIMYCVDPGWLYTARIYNNVTYKTDGNISMEFALLNIIWTLLSVKETKYNGSVFKFTKIIRNNNEYESIKNEIYKESKFENSDEELESENNKKISSKCEYEIKCGHKINLEKIKSHKEKALVYCDECKKNMHVGKIDINKLI